MSSFKNLIDAVGGNVFEERPVTIQEFITNEHYLGWLKISPSKYQFSMLEAATQIYLKPELELLYGAKEGEEKWRKTVNECVFLLGKSSGKNVISSIACAYVVYLLLCLKEPARYYGKPTGDNIDIINVASNAEQAKSVFFNGFTRLIKGSPWFKNRYHLRARDIAFDKNINLYSGHSSFEAGEGKNLMFVVLDEISSLGIDKQVKNNAIETYKAYSATVVSRFPSVGKVVMLSFSRHQGDFIDERYNEVVAEKNTRTISHTFKLNEELPDGLPGNEFTIEYEEDDIVSYRFSKIFALRRASWVINPSKNIDDFKKQFYEDPNDALTRFASTPVASLESFMSCDDKIDDAVSFENGLDANWNFFPNFKPEQGVEYFIHADLAQKQDECVVAMGHVSGWHDVSIGVSFNERMPVVKIDCLRVWTPSKNQTIDLQEVKNFIVSLKKRGFNIKLSTFDRWAMSHDMQKALNIHGLKTDTLSVGLPQFNDLKMLIIQDRIHIPNLDGVALQLKQLRLTKNGNGVEGPRKGHDDISDALAGCAFNAVRHSNQEFNEEVEVFSRADMRNNERENENVGPPPPMPEEIRKFMTKTTKMI